MGQSGAGSGGGGTGGAAGGGGGGYREPADKSGRDPAQKVLTRLKPDYVQRLFVGTLVPGIVQDLVLMSIDLGRGGTWRSLIGRLSLSEQASLQEVCEAIFKKNARNEHDQRILGASRASLAAFFEELTKFDDDLLVNRRKGGSWTANVDHNVLTDCLPRFLAFLIENVLLREEPNSLPQEEADALRELASRRAVRLADGLRNRYKKSGDAGDARVLLRVAANEDDQRWFISKLRA